MTCTHTFERFWSLSDYLLEEKGGWREDDILVHVVKQLERRRVIQAGPGETRGRSRGGRRRNIRGGARWVCVWGSATADDESADAKYRIPLCRVAAAAASLARRLPMWYVATTTTRSVAWTFSFSLSLLLSFLLWVVASSCLPIIRPPPPCATSPLQLDPASWQNTPSSESCCKGIIWVHCPFWSVGPIPLSQCVGGLVSHYLESVSSSSSSSSVVDWVIPSRHAEDAFLGGISEGN